MTVQRRTYRIKGLVQGVGFRPTLWRVAHALKLAGEVWNDAQGVGAILEGDVSVLDCFEEALRKTVQDEAPLARIDSVELVQTQPPVGATDFVITASRQGVAHGTPRGGRRHGRDFALLDLGIPRFGPCQRLLPRRHRGEAAQQRSA